MRDSDVESVRASPVFPATARAQGVFDPGCTLPFQSISEQRNIDKACPQHEGSAADDGNGAQNRAKNNFCATGSFLGLNRKNFVNLQKGADKKGFQFVSATKLPSDRSGLESVSTIGGAPLGEGMRVRYVGLIAKVSTRSKENVNCKQTAAAGTDISMHLLQSQEEVDDSRANALCKSVKAEISPHFRPDAWHDANLFTLISRPVRISGHLFYDHSHPPCKNGQPAPGSHPKRISAWEIHPVYAIDVCKKLAIRNCKVNDDSVWRPLHQWSKEELLNEEEEDPQD